MGTIKYQEKKLFKPLELAETYGSGIRRAKGLLKDNNSPKLEYAPKDHSSEQTLVKIKVPVSTDSLVFLLEEDETFLSKDTVFNQTFRSEKKQTEIKA